MKLLQDVKDINFKAELNAMVQYLSTRWEHIPEPTKLMTVILERAQYDARFFINDHPLWEDLHQRQKQREALLEASLPADEASLVSMYDNPCMLLQNISMEVAALKSIGQNIKGQWDYSGQCTQIYKQLLGTHPSLIYAKPLGWDALYESYSDFKGMAEYCDEHQIADEEAFEGYNTASAGASGFTGRTALPYVMYDEVSQGRVASYVLVSAIYAHFLQLIKHQNTEELRVALQNLDMFDKVPAPVFDVPLQSNHPLAQALIQAKGTIRLRTELEYTAAQEDRRNFSEKNESEKAAITAENASRMEKLLQSISKPSARETAKYETKEQARQKYYHDFLSSIPYVPKSLV